MTPLAALLLPVLIPATSAPIVIRHDKTIEESVELAKRFDATVMFEPDGCGTLIGERWILTAAHVAHGLSPFGATAFIGGKEHRVRQILFHPESASRGHTPPRVDLALVELEKPVEGVKPVPLYEGSDEVGRDVIVVGYGDFGFGNGELTLGNGIRRAATNVVDSAERGRLGLTFSKPEEGTRLEGVGGPGDSGGPLLLETDKGLFLVGVSSGSMGGRPGSYGVTDLYARVSDYKEWIDGTRKDVAGKPPQGTDVIDVTKGFPDDERGALIEAFFKGFGDEEALLAFEKSYRSSDSRRRNPEGAFTRRMLRRAGELGSLTPLKLARVDPRRWVVLARSEKEGWLAVHFHLAPEADAVKLADLGMRPESPPDESGGSGG